MSRIEKRRAEEKKRKAGPAAWIYRIVILILLCIMGFSGYNLYKIYSEYQKGTEIYNDLADEVGANKTGVDNSRLHIDWDKLKEINPDVRAWIRIKGTVLSYPIVQGKDNDHYLYYAITGEESGKGTVFIDYQNPAPFKNFNTIMYGHRMKDGSMFYPITNYFGSGGPDYYAEHPTMEIYTPEKNYDAEVFACATIDATDMAWYQMDFSSSNPGDLSPETNYLSKIYSGNELPVAAESVNVSANDRIIMLSTCTAQGSTYDDHRQIVWAKLVPVEDDAE